MKSLKDFPLDPIFYKWYCDEDDNIFRTTIADLGLKGDKICLKCLVDILVIAADIIRELFRGEKEFFKNLHIRYNRYFRNTPIDERPTIETFDISTVGLKKFGLVHLILSINVVDVKVLKP